MGETVKSIKDLKREIERQKNAHMGEGVLDLLNSFEAGLRERLKEYTTGETPEDELAERDFRTIAKELRRILVGE